MTAVHVARLPLLDPSVQQASAGISPIPSLQATKATTKIGVETFGGSIYSTGPSCPFISRVSGLEDRRLSAANKYAIRQSRSWNCGRAESME